ncbi:ABC transporter substrate-binding protein [Mesorhizobium sp. L-8-10]|uniref:peptide ABC transporter substrate-binding protein n=1 Tax=unclassified Mesorhizobium TaxID=325217 RepID=UPI001925BD20|nr:MULTISPECIES: peptide ABC transporter substrate-binding protein [unclassified Mesorhizobium]BCH21658.1 ABC transporter substrate-binding protein [Mesorhizobium sp. L-8-3]BCH32990.1 ABC transporter substrate-binding protein [Mesorhizobium sp. L-8-10]
MTERSNTKANYSRRDALRLLAIGGAAGLVAPNLLGKPAFAQNPPASPTGRVVVGLSQEPTVFNPLMVHIEVDDGVNFSMFDALFRIDPKGVIQPNLAVEVPTQKNGGISEDGLTWRVRLRDDVRWHDGKPFTADDVKFTLELITKPDFKAWRTAGHSLVRDVTVVSPTEITWRMEEAFAPYLSFLTETFIVPKHLLEKEADPNTAAFNQAPVGTGAFKWGQRIAGDRLELVANPDYFGDGPYIEQLIFKYIPDMTVLYTQFRSGDIDIVGQAYITPDNYEEARNLPDRVVTLVPKASVESIYLNQDRPQFKDPAVREALYAAIDRRAIIDALNYGVPRETETFMPTQSYFFNADLPKHEFNLDRARKLLDDAGWVPGADGIRAKDGVRLSFKNSTTSGAHLREQAQQFIQQTYAEIGVEMLIENLPPAVMWGDFWVQSQFDTAMVGITYLIGSDPDVTNRFHSKAIVAKGGNGSNNAQYSNPEVDALLEEGSRTFDPEKRREIYLKVQEIVRRDLPFLPLFANTTVYGIKKGIEGFVANANTRTESWHAAGWYWA